MRPAQLLVVLALSGCSGEVTGELVPEQRDKLFRCRSGESVFFFRSDGLLETRIGFGGVPSSVRLRDTRGRAHHLVDGNGTLCRVVADLR